MRGVRSRDSHLVQRDSVALALDFDFRFQAVHFRNFLCGGLIHSRSPFRNNFHLPPVRRHILPVARLRAAVRFALRVELAQGFFAVLLRAHWLARFLHLL